jgi:hypothetical protein
MFKKIDDGQVHHFSRFPFLVLEQDAGFTLVDVSEHQCCFSNWPKTNENQSFVFSSKQDGHAFVAETDTLSTEVYTLFYQRNSPLQRRHVCKIKDFRAREIPRFGHDYCVIEGEFLDGSKNHGVLIFPGKDQAPVPFYTCYYSDAYHSVCILHHNEEGVLSLSTYVGCSKKYSVEVPRCAIINAQTKEEHGQTLFVDNVPEFVLPSAHSLQASSLLVTDYDNMLYFIVDVDRGSIVEKRGEDLQKIEYGGTLFITNVKEGNNEPEFFVQHLGELKGPFSDVTKRGPYFVLKANQEQFIYSPNL